MWCARLLFVCLSCAIISQSYQHQLRQQDICSLPPKQGPCVALFYRYYFDPDTQKCETFVYGGCDGNANNFENLDDCIKNCPGPKSLRYQDLRIGPEACSLPAEPGNCKASIPKYFYNSQSKTCESFIYGGCEGNDNNFDTIEDCLKSCHEEDKLLRGQILRISQESCSLPAEPGNCKASIPKYFFNSETKTCESFIYGGCDGNENNFDTIEDCLKNCHGPDKLLRSRSDGESSENTCLMPAVQGNCNAHMPRYYYNAETQTCESFIYGGCGGNDNNFVTREECLQRCFGSGKKYRINNESSLEELLRILNSQEYLQNRASLKRVHNFYDRKSDSPTNLDLNYYYSERSLPQCDAREGLKMCELSCRPNTGFCDNTGNCQCELVTIALQNKHMLISYIPSTNPLEEEDDSSPLEFDEEQPFHLSRRHHIAHFCPNIELARQCIKKCLAEGLPAFCNQEKLCYCGHLYTAHDKIDEQNKDHANSQFKDLIEKYLLDPKLADTKPL